MIDNTDFNFATSSIFGAFWGRITSKEVKMEGLDLPKTILIAKAEDGNDDDGSDHFDNLGEVSSLMPTPEFHQS